MASEIDSGNGAASKTPETDFPATVTVETERTVETEAPPTEEAEPVVDHPMVNELAPAVETTIPEKINSAAAPEKEGKPVVASPAETINCKKERRGWPGDCVFRVIVPALKVERIIGPNGDLIKKMCEETKADIRLLEDSVCNPDRIVQISGREDTEAPLSPAMDAVIRVFKCVNGFPENESDGVASNPFCSIRLLLTSMQAMSLNGKQGSSINKIEENTGCSVCILSSDEVSINSDDRVIHLQGEGSKVLEALEAVVRHLRMFLVDRSILPLSKKTSARSSEAVTWAEKSIVHTDINPWKFQDCGPQNGSPLFSSSELSFFGCDPVLSSTKSPPGFGRPAGPSVTQVTETMEISLLKAVNMIGIRGTNIANIGRTSGATVSVEASKGSCKQITVEIKGTFSQVKTAKKLLLNQTLQVNGTPFLGPTRRRKKKKKASHFTAAPALPAGEEVSYEPQVPPSSATSPPSAAAATATEAPVGPHEDEGKEVPPQLPRVQPAPALPVIGPSDMNGSKQSRVGWGPSSSTPTPAIDSHAVEGDEETVILNNILSLVSPSSCNSPVKSKQITVKRTMSVFEEEMLGVLRTIADNMNKPEPPSKPTFEDCEKKLNGLGWTKDDPLHLLALTIFCDANHSYRDLWMKLHPERCANWVRMIGRSKRLL